MYCNNCGRPVNPNTGICANCGAKNGTSGGKAPKNDNNKVIMVLIIGFVVLGILIAIVGFAIAGKDDDNGTTTDAITDSIEIEDDESESESEEGTSVDAGKLYRPSKDKFCDQYERYISGYFEGQGYAKMRFGPSKTKYNVVGQIDNGSIVTVQTKSVDGWTLIYYQGKEGWVRTDFLFANYDDCFGKATLPDSTDENYCAIVDISDEYDGEPLRMRTGPGKNYELITEVPDDSQVTVLGTSNKTDDWVYISYNGHHGWVLSKYVFEEVGTGDKPVLYLYPEKITDISVKVQLNDMRFTCTYPEYNTGWSVTARPDGTLINKADGKEYSYLYWELAGKQNYDFSKGFVVKGCNTAEFLQDKLAEIGLTPKEYNEFIVYWLPKMQNNEYNLISFQTTTYTDNVKLDINPKPDSVLRVFMAYKPIEKPIAIEPQRFDKFERKGFTVVEWGGVEVK